MVQTLFKEFRELPLPFKLAERAEEPGSVESLDALVSTAREGFALPATESHAR